jgi:hypothetical protein
VGEMTARDLAELILDAVGETAADKLAAALHLIVVGATDVCAEFNRIVASQHDFDDQLERRGLRRSALHRLASKNGFGAN